jgi:hypothetical protein
MISAFADPKALARFKKVAAGYTKNATTSTAKTQKHIGAPRSHKEKSAR